MLSNTPKIAIVCYSKSGHSRQVADRIAAHLSTSVFALHTARYHMPFLGYLRAGLDSLRRNFSPLTHPLPDLTGYDAAIICGPIWTSYPAAPLSTFFKEAALLPPVLGLMLTHGNHSPPQKAFEQAEREIGRSFTAKDSISNNIENTPEAARRIADFARTVVAAAEMA